MDLSSFRAGLEQDSPAEGTPSALCVLWWAEKGDWDKAHEIAQEMPDPEGAWLHAHLHREEGDLENARYWYRRARRTMPEVGIREEREQLLLHFLP